MYLLRNIEARSHNDFCCRKTRSITYSECVFVALGIQHELRVSGVILPFVVCMAVTRF